MAAGVVQQRIARCNQFHGDGPISTETGVQSYERHKKFDALLLLRRRCGQTFTAKVNDFLGLERRRFLQEDELLDVVSRQLQNLLSILSKVSCRVTNLIPCNLFN